MQQPVEPAIGAPSPPVALHLARREATNLRELSAHQWRSGIAAWLGWLFDGLDMHLYTLVALPFVTELLGLTDQKDPTVGYHGSLIQAAFLAGWALGGGFFGRIGDRIGRAKALSLTILTYALFTGLSFFAQTWWHLFLFRFLAALGIGGEWAVGSALLAETWPRRWRPWIAAVLQSAVNIGVMLAMLATYLMSGLAPRWVFLVGILPALLVFWIRRAVPEPEEWQTAKARAAHAEPGVVELFRGSVLPITVKTLLVCALSLSAHWAFMYWFLQHLRLLPIVEAWEAGAKQQFASVMMVLVMVTSVMGNFVAGGIARVVGYRRTIVLMCLAYFLAMLGAYGVARPYQGLIPWLALIGVCQGLFGLFTMYLPPLFPTLLRTTGAGFCYNIGRIAAACAVVFFGVFSKIDEPGSFRFVLLYSSCLFPVAAAVAMLLPEPPDEARSPAG